MFKDLRRQIEDIDSHSSTPYSVFPKKHTQASVSSVITELSSSTAPQFAASQCSCAVSTSCKPLNYNADLPCSMVPNRVLEKAYEEYRQKTSDLLEKKEIHIERLQERVRNLEERLQAVQTDNAQHVLVAERDALFTKCQSLEDAFEAERGKWKRELEKVKCSPTLDVGNSLDNVKATKLSETCSRKLARKDSSSESVPDSCSRVPEVVIDEAAVQNDKENLDQSEYENEAQPTKAQFETSLQDTVQFLQLEIEQLRSKERERIMIELAHSREIGSEQQFTSLANELEDMQEAIDNQHRDLTVMYERLREKTNECSNLEEKMKSMESRQKRQQEVIEQLRDELDKCKEKYRDVSCDKENLLLRNASLFHELENARTEAKVERERISLQLEELSIELESHREMVQELQVYQEEQQALHNIKQQLLEQTEHNRSLLLEHEKLKRAVEVSESKSKHHREVNERYIRNVLLRFLTASEEESIQLIRVISTILQLSPQEEDCIRERVKGRMTSPWLPIGMQQPLKPRLVKSMSGLNIPSRID